MSTILRVWLFDGTKYIEFDENDGDVWEICDKFIKVRSKHCTDIKVINMRYVVRYIITEKVVEKRVIYDI